MELRLLLDDIIHALMEDDIRRLTTSKVYRLMANILESWLDQRTQLELGTSRQRDSDQPRKKSTTNRKNEYSKKGSAAAAK